VSKLCFATICWMSTVSEFCSVARLIMDTPDCLDQSSKMRQPAGKSPFSKDLLLHTSWPTSKTDSTRSHLKGYSGLRSWSILSTECHFFRPLRALLQPIMQRLPQESHRHIHQSQLLRWTHPDPGNQRQLEFCRTN
jgi:hypothetical protein